MAAIEKEPVAVLGAAFAHAIEFVGGEGEIAGEPKLAHIGAGSFHLRPGSPCRGAGLRLPDMGQRDYYGTPLPQSGPAGDLRPVDVGCAATGTVKRPES